MPVFFKTFDNVEKMLYKSDQICVSSTTALQAGSPMWELQATLATCMKSIMVPRQFSGDKNTP
jgi:hypothetical protein